MQKTVEYKPHVKDNAIARYHGDASYPVFTPEPSEHTLESESETES